MCTDSICLAELHAMCTARRLTVGCDQWVKLGVKKAAELLTTLGNPDTKAAVVEQSIAYHQGCAVAPQSRLHVIAGQVKKIVG